MVGLGMGNTYTFAHGLSSSFYTSRFAAIKWIWFIQLDYSRSHACWTWIWLYKIRAPNFLFGCHQEWPWASVFSDKQRVDFWLASINPEETNMKGPTRRTCSTAATIHALAPIDRLSHTLTWEWTNARWHRQRMKSMCSLLLPLLASVSSSTRCCSQPAPAAGQSKPVAVPRRPPGVK